MTRRSKKATLTAVAASLCLGACGSSADVAKHAPHAKPQSHAAPARGYMPATPHAASLAAQSPAAAEAASSGGSAMELTVKQGTSASQLKKLLSKLTGTPRHVRTSHRRGGLDSLLGRGGKGSQQAASSKPAQGGVLSQILQKHPGAATGKPNAP